MNPRFGIALVLFTAAAMSVSVTAEAFKPTVTEHTVTYTANHPCFGETVQFTSTLTVSFATNQMSGPDVLHLVYRVKQKGTGVGLTSGRRYHVSECVTLAQNVDTRNPSGEANGVLHLVLISEGGGPNLQAMQHVHLQVTPSGRISIREDPVVFTCSD